jgi:hypothetical protein
MSVLDNGRHPHALKYMYAPMAAFAVPRNGGAIRSFAIQCGQDPVGREIYTPADGYSGKLAKNCVLAAHNTYHGVLTHRRPLRGPAIPGHQRAVRLSQRSFEPPLHVEQYPALVGVMDDRLQREAVRHGVERSPRPTTRVEDLPSSVRIARPRHPFEGQSLQVLGGMRRHGVLELLLVLPDGSSRWSRPGGLTRIGPVWTGERRRPWGR